MRANALLLALAVAVAASAAGAATPGSAAAADADADAQASPAAAPQTDGNDFAMPPELIAKLSSEQIAAILREREMSRSRFPARPPDVRGEILFFGTLLAMVLLAQVYATRRERLRQETLRAMVEKGLEIPAGLVTGGASPSSDLRRGLVLLGAGAGLSLLFAIVRMNGRGAEGLWSIGLVPILMGAGYLVAWRIETRSGQGG